MKSKDLFSDRPQRQWTSMTVVRSPDLSSRHKP